jgi:hypothetical protein
VKHCARKSCIKNVKIEKNEFWTRLIGVYQLDETIFIEYSENNKTDSSLGGIL